MCQCVQNNTPYLHNKLEYFHGTLQVLDMRRSIARSSEAIPEEILGARPQAGGLKHVFLLALDVVLPTTAFTFRWGAELTGAATATGSRISKV